MIEQKQDQKHGDCICGPLYGPAGKVLQPADGYEVESLLQYGYVAFTDTEEESLKSLIGFPVCLYLPRAREYDEAADGWHISVKLRPADCLSPETTQRLQNAIIAPHEHHFEAQADARRQCIHVFLRTKPG